MNFLRHFEVKVGIQCFHIIYGAESEYGGYQSRFLVLST